MLFNKKDHIYESIIQFHSCFNGATRLDSSSNFKVPGRCQSETFVSTHRTLRRGALNEHRLMQYEPGSASGVRREKAACRMCPNLLHGERNHHMVLYKVPVIFSSRLLQQMSGSSDLFHAIKERAPAYRFHVKLTKRKSH